MLKSLQVQVPKYQKYQLQYILSLHSGARVRAEPFPYAFLLMLRHPERCLKKDSFIKSFILKY